MNGRRLSIIVPVLNEAPRIAALGETLAAWRAAGHELIVVDGGSTDGSVDAARARGADQVLTCATGRARQMNVGAAAARHDLLVFLHADTQVMASSRQTLEALPAGRVWGRFDLRLDGRLGSFRVIEAMINRRSRLTGVATGDQCLFVDRGLFEAVNGFPDWPLMEDIGLARLLCGHARPLCLAEQVTTSARRWESNGVLRTVLAMWYLRVLFALGAPPSYLAGLYYGREPGARD